MKGKRRKRDRERKLGRSKCQCLYDLRHNARWGHIKEKYYSHNLGSLTSISMQCKWAHMHVHVHKCTCTCAYMYMVVIAYL